MVRKFENDETLNVENTEAKGEVTPLFKGDWEHLSDEKIMEEKYKFLENYFTSKVVRYSKPRHGKYVDVIVEPASSKSKSAIYGLYSSYRHLFNYELEDFMGEVMTCISSAVYQFKPNQDIFNWQQVNVKDSSENNRLHAYIVKPGSRNISVLESMLLDYTNMINWKERKGDTIREINMSSLDSILTDAEGNEYTLHDEIGEESDVFHVAGGYAKPHFLIWWDEFYKEQKKLRASSNRRVKSKAKLTQLQLNYLEVMKQDFIGELVSEPKINEDEDKFERPFGTQEEQYKRSNRLPEQRYNPQEIYYFNNTIGNIAIQAYRAEFPNGMTFLGNKHERDIELLNGIIDIVYSDKVEVSSMGIKKKQKSLNVQNGILSKFIIDNFSEGIIHDIIYDHLSGKDTGSILAAKMDNKKRVASETLYRFVEAAERLKRIVKTTDTTAAKFYKKPEEFTHTKADTEARKSGAVYVYDLEGNLKYKIDPQEIKKPTYKIQRITSNGLVDVDIFDDNNF